MIDSHAHVTGPALLPEAEQVIARAKQAGVRSIVNICTDLSSLQEGIKLHDKHPSLFNCAATHPHDVEKEGSDFLPHVLASLDKLVAIGETGLDYYYEYSPKVVQQKFLKRYLALAQETGLPVIFHCREAMKDLFAICDVEYKNGPAVMHCFTGTLEEAKEALNRGWYISFSGVITYKKSEELREVVRYVPLDRIFVETDAPFLAPQSRRGKQNEPAFVIETAAKVAEVKGITLEEVEHATEKNCMQFFGLKL